MSPFPSDSYVVSVVPSGHVRLVTPEGRVFVSRGAPNPDKVRDYLDMGYVPEGSAKWTEVPSAPEDRRSLSDLRASMGRMWDDYSYT